MHPTLELLLELRDGEPTAATSAHVAECGECAAEVERLRRTAAALRSLPDLRPARDLWPSVRAEIEGRRKRRRMEWFGGAALALAASLTFIFVAPRALRQSPSPAPTPPSTSFGTQHAAPGEIDSLVRKSQRLEAALRQYEPEGRVIDAGSASNVVEIEDSIALIDARLSSTPVRRTSSNEVTGLWRDRVRLMDALVRAHDARPVYAGL